MSRGGAARRTDVVPPNAGAEWWLLCDGGAEVASWPLLCPDGVDLSVVDELAKVHLEARRQG